MTEERRISEVERRVSRLEDRTEVMAVNSQEIRHLWQAVQQLRTDLKLETEALAQELSSVRRALYTAALSVAGGVLLGALTLLQVFK